MSTLIRTKLSLIFNIRMGTVFPQTVSISINSNKTIWIPMHIIDIYRIFIFYLYWIIPPSKFYNFANGHFAI